MHKMKNQLMEKVIAADLTSVEFDVYMYLFSIQDRYGQITGVYYKDVLEQTKVRDCSGDVIEDVTVRERSKYSFYLALEGLTKKGLIRTSKSHAADIDVTIMGSSFYHDERYIDYTALNKAMLFSPAFRSMKVKAKLLALELLQLIGKQEKHGSISYLIGTEEFYKKYTKKLKVAKRAIQHYLTQLRKFFNIHIKDHKYMIKNLRWAVTNEGLPSENQHTAEHVLRMLFRREKIRQYPDQDLQDMVRTLINCEEQFTQTSDEGAVTKREAVCEHRAINAMSRAVKNAVSRICGRKNPVPKPNWIQKNLNEVLEAFGKEVGAAEAKRKTPASARV